MTALTDAVLATSPLHYWPLQETSGTSAADLVVTGTKNGTATGMTMGGADAPTWIGGKCPTFSGAGTDYIEVSTSKILGGLNAWSIGAWMRYATTSNDLTRRAFYGEGTSSGTIHNMLGAGAFAGNTMSIFEGYQQAAETTATFIQGPTTYLFGLWGYIVVTRIGARVETWFNCGMRYFTTTGSTGNTWTDAAHHVRIGQAAQGSWPFMGQVCHLAIWDRAITVAGDMRPIYQAATPLTRTLTSKKFFAPTAIVNQDLTVVGNEPTIVADGGVTAQRLANQVATYGTGTNESTGPFYTMPPGSPRSRIRVSGGLQNIAFSPAEFHAAFQSVPVPANFVLPVTSDREGQIYAEDTDELWEGIQLQQTITPVGSPATSVSTGGTLPAGTYVWGVAGAAADGSWGQFAFFQATLNGSQKAVLSWTPAEDVDHYQVFRLAIGGVLPWRLHATTPANVLFFVDDGSIPWTGPIMTNPNDYHGTNVTTDWGLVYGGYLADTNHNLGFQTNAHSNWGAAATGIPLWAGSISLTEAMASLTNVNAIDHALAMGLPEVDPSGFVYPALRNDGLSGANQIKEGIRFQLDPAFDLNTVPYTFDKAVCKALQKYGAYIRDTTQLPSFYVEMNVGTGGRDIWTDVLQGRYSYEIFRNYTFPWTQLRVVDPEWTRSQTVVSPAPPAKIATLADGFDDATGTLDTAKWPLHNFVAIVVGRLSMQTTPGYQGSLGSVGASANYYDLTSSSFYFEVVQVPSGDPGSEAGLVLFNRSVTDCYVEMVYSDGGKLICGYNSSGGVRTRVVQPTFDPVAHRWWRIRHASGTVFWEASATGTTWSTLGSILWANTGWASTNLEALGVKFYAGNFNGHAGNPDFVLDNVNTAGAPPPPPPPPTPTGSGIFTIASSPWGDGTTVKVYLASGWVNVDAPPAGPVITSAVVASGRVTFTGLTPNIRYIAYADGIGRSIMAVNVAGSEFTDATPGKDRNDTVELEITALKARVAAIEAAEVGEA